MQNAAQLTGTDKDLAAVAQAMAAALPKATPSKAAKAANPPKGATPTGAAKAKRAAKAPSKAVTVVAPATEQPAKRTRKAKAEKAEPSALGPISDAIKAIGEAKRAAAPKAIKVRAPKVDKVQQDAQIASAKAVVRGDKEGAAQAKLENAPKAPAVIVGVYQDANRHTCIVCSVGRKLVNYVPMDSAGLAVVKMSIDKFVHDWQVVAGYPVDKAAAQYLAGTIACTPQAEEVLRALAGQAAGKPLAKGTPVPVMSKGDEADKADAMPVQPRSAAPGKAKAAGAAAPRAGKAWPNAGRKLVVGAAKVADKVREGTFRRALMDHVVAVAKKGGTTDDCLGKVVMEGKPACAKVDVDFAVQCGYVKFA